MFEQEAKQYLDNLVTTGVILTGDLVGVSENQLVAKALVIFLTNGLTKESFIAIKKVNDVISWYYLSVSDQNDREKTNDDWAYPTQAKRIVAPIGLIMNDIGIKMYGWFQLNKLPIETENNQTQVHLYCNTILPEHQSVVDSLSGIVTIEDRPV